MESMKLASGDNKCAQEISPRHTGDVLVVNTEEEKSTETEKTEDSEQKSSIDPITTQIIDENECKLKERIAHCRDIIESLKIELNQEKVKLERDSKLSQRSLEPVMKCTPACQYMSSPDRIMEDFGYTSSTYSECVENKLNCDEHLMKYEKQLQKYQNTLNMAQIEKKNAIRKQMMAKAYKLKLLEVENQCNIELLRVKQSLQCLEPLQMIVNNWKTSNADGYDVNNFELIPRYPELHTNTSNEFNNFNDEFDKKMNTENQGETASLE